MIPVPRRPLLTMDPTKLSYFARAHMARAGAMSTYGALQGFGAYEPAGYAEMIGGAPPPAVSTEPGAYSGPGARSGWVSDTAVPYARTGSNNLPEAEDRSIDRWMNQLNNLLIGSASRGPGAASFKPSPWPLVIGGAAVLAGGFLLYRVMKK